MRPRRIPVWAAIALASAATAFADPPANIYVTTGVGRQVLAIPINPTTGIQGGPVQVLVTADAPLTDIAQKSDGGLYYATPTEIRRVGQAAAVASVAGAQELRFSAYNCLFYNSATGVNSIACGNPAAAGSGGRGLAFDLFGNLLAISGSTVVRIPVSAAGVEGAPETIVESGLTAPAGIAVASGKGANGLERGDFVVLDGRRARLYDGKTRALKNAAYATVPVGQTLAFGDFDADDRLWLAAMTGDQGTAQPNGRIYRAAAGGAVCTDQGGSNCALVASLPRLSSNKYWPAVGLALGPSSRRLTRAIAPAVPSAEQTFAFDFGASILEISGTVLDACDIDVRSSATFAQAAATLVGNAQYSSNPYLGEEGFTTVYNIEARKGGATVNAAACFDTSSEPFVFIAAVTSTEVNPRVLRCHNGCSEIKLFGWWHTGPIDGDGEGGGRTDNFSQWLVVEKAIAPAGNQISFCGVAPPLRMDGTAVFNTGSNLTLKVQFSAPGQSCASGVYLTDPNATFLISLAKIEPVYAKKRLIAASGNSGVPATLEQGGKSYEFELSLKNPDGTDYDEGTYEITLTDITPNGSRLTAPVTIYFRAGKK